HTTIGAEALSEAVKGQPWATGFLQIAIDIIRHHHERWDGKGYPDRLAGTAIPLSARIVSIADVYDALRCRRPYRPALSHNAALQLMLDPANSQFDPGLLKVFEANASHFERIFSEMPG